MNQQKNRAGKIIYIAPNSLAEEIGLAVGDEIVAVNETAPKDIIDLSFALAEEEIELLVRHADGEEEIIAFDKDCDEELGAEFASAVFDGIRPCANHCRFCFVDQMPPGLRPSLYIKDDDYRLSFLYGNFITLTNLGEADFRRIAALHLSPLFVSVHALDMALRAEIMQCKKAARLDKCLDRLAADGIKYHAQVVLCPGLNDGAALLQTIDGLWARREAALSLGIVPVGLTKYRNGCYPLSAFDRAGAAAVIDMVEARQKKFRAESGAGFVYLADEFYLLAGRELPLAEAYDDFPQLDNGIGLVRSFIDDWQAAAESDKAARKELSSASDNPPPKIALVAGTSFAPLLARLAKEMTGILPRFEFEAIAASNEFFGPSVNVSGLLTGRDIRRAIKATGNDFSGAIIPASCLRTGENIFLDGESLDDLTRALNCPVVPILKGDELYAALADWDAATKNFAAKDNSRRKTYMWQTNAAYNAAD